MEIFMKVGVVHTYGSKRPRWVSTGNEVIMEVSANDLRGCDLSGRDIQWANLEGHDLSYADLSNSNLSGADMRRANLTGTILKGAMLYGVDLRNTILEHADLTGAFMSGSRLEAASLLGAEVRRVKALQIRYDEATIWPNGSMPDGWTVSNVPLLRTPPGNWGRTTDSSQT